MEPDFYGKLLYLPVMIPVLIAAAVLHELAHAFTATWLGDRTPKEQGRLTLNPIKHLDPFGSALFLFTFLFTSFPFGWAKPVMVNRHSFKNHKWGMAIVAIAGPLVNIIIAAVIMAYAVHGPAPAGEYMQNVIVYAIQINIVLSIFNMLPIPPLDGSRVIGVFMKDSFYEEWAKLDEYAILFFVMIFLIFSQQVGILISDAFVHIQHWLFILVGG